MIVAFRDAVHFINRLFLSNVLSMHICQVYTTPGDMCNWSAACAIAQSICGMLLSAGDTPEPNF